MTQSDSLNRRNFLRHTGVGGAAAALSARCGSEPIQQPNLVFIFADQWRAQDTGYAGNPEVITPNLDAFAAESINLTNTVSGCPVCCPYRGTLMTGQYPLTHGVFLNDVYLDTNDVTFPGALNAAGYDTGYIGKWHLDAHGRLAFTPPERRLGFKYWKALECSHNYNNSLYYDDSPEQKKWEGYDSISQSQDACKYIREHKSDNPFALFLSWGPPHAPYLTAPEEYRNKFNGDNLTIRPNVPAEMEKTARRDYAGYYAHMTALDDCLQTILDTIDDSNLRDNTIVVFTSDHGDMLYSHGSKKKQQPQEESVCVPFLVRYPATLKGGQTIDMPFSTSDIMPTLLGLCGIEVPGTVEGDDCSGVLRGTEAPFLESSLISCPAPFGQWTRSVGGREYRGVRTRQYTYARDLNGPWLLFDNAADPYQQHNLVNEPEYASVQQNMEEQLQQWLTRTNDKFLPANDYIKQWGYRVDVTGTVPFWEQDPTSPKYGKTEWMEL
jgi:arylsulfatase A-like enzyme